jgi:hypothetical protein
MSIYLVFNADGVKRWPDEAKLQPFVVLDRQKFSTASVFFIQSLTGETDKVSLLRDRRWSSDWFIEFKSKKQAYDYLKYRSLE